MTPEELIAEIEKRIEAQLVPVRVLAGWAAGGAVGSCFLLFILIAWIS